MKTRFCYMEIILSMCFMGCCSFPDGLRLRPFRPVQARALYVANMKVLANRVNTFTGVAYKDDSTIFAWNLMNEPRFPADQQPRSAASIPVCLRFPIAA